jgi:hypothetical protein
MPNLSEKDKQALRLAGDLQKAIDQWLGLRGVEQSCAVSPFVDPAGEPAVIIRMNANVAGAMIDGLRPPEGSPRPPRGGGPAEPFPGGPPGPFPGPPAGPSGPSSPSGYFPFKP